MSGTPAPRRALVEGLAGVAMFSASLPATRLAVTELDPLFVTAARAAIAGLAAAAVLLVASRSRPARGDLAALVGVALGIVVGFPVLTALALRSVSAAHAAAFVGLMPLATALFAALRAGERPAPAFWLFSVIGSAATMGFAAYGAGAASLTGDALMLAAVTVGGYGYAEGGRLARRIGGWQVIAWAGLIGLPAALPLAWILWPEVPVSRVGAPALIGLAYLGLVSSLIGFVFWYRALATGGIAVIGQLQLLQPFLGMLLAGAVLGEHVEPRMLTAACLVALCVAAARRMAAPPGGRARAHRPGVLATTDPNLAATLPKTFTRS